ncbi:Protein of unknown function [Cotesia congregata]|uniref:Uncharacterized protein n=1 Tax=Cotesia congregata TaxID=51543 RepID=A0A8J2ECH8_COTCN|nr:Protein of unknown function [Cotesia congregata]
MSPKHRILANYIDVYIELTTKKLTSTKKVFYMMLNAGVTPKGRRIVEEEAWNKVSSINDSNHFLTFDIHIKGPTILTQILKTAMLLYKTMFFEIITDDCLDYIKAIRIILPEMIPKEVHLLYSGAGRIEFITHQYGSQNRTLKVLTTLIQIIDMFNKMN